MQRETHHEAKITQVPESPTSLFEATLKTESFFKSITAFQREHELCARECSQGSLQRVLALGTARGVGQRGRIDQVSRLGAGFITTKNKQGWEDRMEETGEGRWAGVQRDLGLWVLGCWADI